MVEFQQLNLETLRSGHLYAAHDLLGCHSRQPYGIDKHGFGIGTLGRCLKLHFAFLLSEAFRPAPRQESCREQMRCGCTDRF